MCGGNADDTALSMKMLVFLIGMIHDSMEKMLIFDLLIELGGEQN